MRHLFDQYDGDENRLTHALVCCLTEDRKLLRAFARWATGRNPPPMKHLYVVEQMLPGEEEVPESEAERRGLPDAWIHDDKTWALIIESKVSAPVIADQLHRHKWMALRRGFENHHLLVLSPGHPGPRSLAGARHKTWSEVYTWFSKESRRSAWAARMVEYMEIAEVRMTAKGYLENGTITRFSGIPFDADNPYEYREAKRVLRLAMDELRKNKQLRKLGMDPQGQGRPAITGKAGSAVWDFLPLKTAKGATLFTEYPHLDIGIQRNRLLAVVTIPNGIKREFRRNLINLGEEEFFTMILAVAGDISKRLRKAKGAKPWMEVVQRHFPAMKSSGIEDARIEFDLRTALPKSTKRRKACRSVKSQPEWIEATYHAWSKKRSNLQICVGAIFPYTCDVLHTRDALECIAATWLACKPLIKAALGTRYR